MANDDNMGALWKKNGPKGDYFSGSVEVNGEKINIVVFPNSFKKAENHPDYRILKSRPKGEQEAPKSASYSPQNYPEPQQLDDFPGGDDIPF